MFENCLKNESSKIREIFNFDKDAIKSLKKLRDGAAHGFDEKAGKPDYERLIALERKIRVFFCYLFLKDLGIPESIFIQNLDFTLNQDVRNTDLNEVAVARYGERVPFIGISNEDYLRVVQSKLNTVVFVFSDDAIPVVDFEASEAAEKWYSDSKGFRDQKDYVKSFYPAEDLSVEYLGRSYIELVERGDVHALFVAIKVTRSSK